MMQDASARFRIDDVPVGSRAKAPAVAATFFYGDDGVLEALNVGSNNGSGATQMTVYQFDTLVGLVKKHRKFGVTA